MILGGGDARHTETVRVLVEGEVDVSLGDRDRDGVTPLDHARRSGYREIVEILESAGAKG